MTENSCITKTDYLAGSVVSMINTFRSELFLPVRLQYNWIKFTTSSPAKIEFQTVEERQISVTKEQMPQLDKQISKEYKMKNILIITVLISLSCSINKNTKNEDIYITKH
ncbi:hypothetical protein [Flavobacterium sp. HNIBRBA15423]|uniref:hypothetical protein n=1 Tax=Flavobacterium sp. HNIBRBA15423 TaxID=3458683 RepID=UPI00404445F2